MVGGALSVDRVVATDSTGYLDPTVTSVPGARVLSGSNQQIATNTNTIVTFNTSVYVDDWQMWDGAVPNRLTIQVPGVYLVGCSIAFAANATGVREVFLRSDGVNVLAYDSRLSVGAARPTRMTVVAEEYFQGGDYIQAIAFQNTGAALDILVQSVSSAVLWARYQSPSL